MTATEVAEPKNGATRGVVREWAPLAVSVVVVALIARAFLVQAYEIPTPSMVPTLGIGDRVLVNKLSYGLGEVERGQVIVFDRPPAVEGKDDFIKRIIGMPGETVRIIDGQVYVDQFRVVEPYLREPDSTFPTGAGIPGCTQEATTSILCTIPDEHVFVMGDNRTSSTDSRVFGPIPIDTIVGRATATVWPPTSLGRL